MKARYGMVLRIGSVFLAIWIVFSGVMTWCTAKTMDRYLEEENSQIASNLIHAAQLQRFADDPNMEQEIKDYWIWDGVNSNWLDNQFGGGLLRHTDPDPQTAVALYSGNGELVEYSENSFYIQYMTEEHWHTQASDMDYDGVAKTLYDPSQITTTALQVIQRTDWIAMRFTGTLENGYLTASKIEYIPYDAYRDLQTSYYGDGSYQRHQRIQEMEERYGLTWETLMASNYDAEGQQVYYTLNGHVSYYIAGKSLKVGGVVYGNLMDYVLQMKYTSAYGDYYNHKQGNLWDTLLTNCRAVYQTAAPDAEPVYRVVAAVRYSPMKIAASSLLYIYIGSFVLLMLCAVMLWRTIYRKLLCHMEAFNDAVAEDWKTIRADQKNVVPWQEAQILRDNYHQIRMERSRLMTSLQYAQEAEANRRQLTSHIAHELKTPLAVIHSYAEGLKEHIAEEKRDRYTDVILAEVERTDHMVLEMLDLSRLEAGKVKLARDEVSLMDLTQSIFEKLEMAAQSKNLNIEFSFPKAFTITADEGRIAQVIENFATNAIKYTPAGGNIQVRIQSGPRGATFTIENDSAPLSPEALSKVWDAFYRTDEARSGRGTGLGLTIAKNIVELHGGNCSVRNTKTGVEFSFTI